MRRLTLLLIALTGLASAAAGCNRGETVRVASGSVMLTLSDYRIVPQRVRVEPGRVTFLVRNDSRLAHNWQLRGRGGVRGRITTLKPGESGTVTVRLRRGTYRMYCAIGHHEELGEYGTVSARP
jgi:uncharacterized cupredoxin-like copper-binding protein